jgi:hypothetical protein
MHCLVTALVPVPWHCEQRERLRAIPNPADLLISLFSIYTLTLNVPGEHQQWYAVMNTELCAHCGACIRLIDRSRVVARLESIEPEDRVCSYIRGSCSCTSSELHLYLLQP